MLSSYERRCSAFSWALFDRQVIIRAGMLRHERCQSRHLAYQWGLYQHMQDPLFIRCAAQRSGGDAASVLETVTPTLSSPLEVHGAGRVGMAMRY